MLENRWEWIADVLYFIRPDMQAMLESIYGKDAIKWEVKESQNGTDD